MISSMTGFGKAVATHDGYAFEVETKSVNNRYLEVSVKLPQSLQAVEYEIRELVRKKLKRGKVYVNINIRQEASNGNNVFLNETRLHEIHNAFKKIRATLEIEEEVSLRDFIHFKELFTPDTDLLNDDHVKALKRAASDALDNLKQMRNSEGEELQKDLKDRVRIIDENVAKIEALAESSVRENFERYIERAKELVENITEYTDRLEMELALLAERADIAEECVRLKSHTKFFAETLSSGNDAGRKLNFLCQEMHRETNTISSKALSTEITHIAVLMKEEVERIREQVQNIE